MTTPRTHARVSLAATMAVTLALAACVRASSSPALDGPAPMESHPLLFRFVNEEREYVNVYLIGDQREWRLGRVDPGAIATFRIPASLAANSRFVQLAVIMGGRITLHAARSPVATFTIVQPASAIVAQQWRFADGQITPVRLWDPRADARRP